MSTNQQGLQTAAAGVQLLPEVREVAHKELDRLLDSPSGSSTHDMRVAAAFMEWARDKHILLTPVFGAVRMRDGFELAFNKLTVNTNRSAKEVYPVSGNDDDKDFADGTELGFHKATLYKIARHLGISIVRETRKDDRRDSMVCEIEASGYFIDIDGTVKPLSATGAIDLRDDCGNGKPSGRIAKIRAEARTPAKAETKIRAQRDKIVQLTATNACERLIVSYGFRGSYSKAELDNQYIICVRPIFTGYSDNENIRMMFARETAKAMAGSAGMLYGTPALNAAPNEDEPLMIEAPSSPAVTPGETSIERGEGAVTSEARAEGQQTTTPTSDPSKAPTVYVLKTGKFSGKSPEAFTDSQLSLAVGYYDNLKTSTKDEAQLTDIQLDLNALHAVVDSRKEESQGEPQGELKL